ncbi:MAG: hypothetical protein ABUT20_38835 [Bacteroidota bacterium]
MTKKTFDLESLKLSELTESEIEQTEGGLFFLIPILVVAAGLVLGYIAGKNY